MLLATTAALAMLALPVHPGGAERRAMVHPAGVMALALGASAAAQPVGGGGGHPQQLVSGAAAAEADATWTLVAPDTRQRPVRVDHGLIAWIEHRAVLPMAWFCHRGVAAGVSLRW